MEICSACHPFFTGKQKVIDAARRVEKFQAKRTKQTQIQDERKFLSKKIKHAAREQKKQTQQKKDKASAKAALKAAKAALLGEN